MAEYITVNNVRTWYDERGSGEPLVLLHGGFTDAREFTGNLGTLADRFLLPERRGHGHTPDVEGPVTLELLAEDLVAFIETVAGGPVHLAGYSAGGVVAMLAALRRPDLVRRLVLISTAAGADGWMFLPRPGGRLPEQLADAYAEVSPDGREHLQVVVDKYAAAIGGHPPLDPAGITSPTLVMASDDDIVHLEHTVALYRAIPDAQLAVVPGSSHVLLIERPATCTALVAEFLTTSPAPIMPIRRAAGQSAGSRT